MHSGFRGDPELPHPALEGAVVVDGEVDAQADAVVGALRSPPAEQTVEVYPTHLRPCCSRPFEGAYVASERVSEEVGLSN